MLRAIVVLTVLVTVLGVAEASSRIPENRMRTSSGVQPQRQVLRDEANDEKHHDDKVSNEELGRRAESKNGNDQDDSYDDSSYADDEAYASDDLSEMWDQPFFYEM